MRTHLIRLLSCLSLILLTFTLMPCQAAMFLKIDGIDGESQDASHANEIDVLSFSFGVTQTISDPSGGGGGAGKATFADISFSKRLDKASPKLYEACASGKHIAQAILTLRRDGEKGVEYYKVTLSDVLVSSISTGGSAGDAVPTETLSLNYTRIEWEYTPQKDDGSTGGSVKSGWDLSTNTKT
jgi:type VI secretion system secreted protein Hcp